MRALGELVSEYCDSGGSGDLRPDKRVYLSDFTIGDKVHVDGDTSMRFVVTTLSWDGRTAQYELGWFREGLYYEKWFEGWRLSPVDPSDNRDGARETWPRP